MTIRETDYMSELEAATRMRPARASAIMLYSVLGLIVLFFLWAGFSKVDMLVRGQGQVVPTSEIQIVQSLEGGILQELMVREGDRVAKDQVLMRLSDVFYSSEQGGAQAQSLTLRAKRARLEAESTGAALTLPADVVKDAPQIAANEKALYESRQRELANATSITKDKIDKANAEIAETKAQINRLGSSAGLLNQELAITRKMVEQKAVPKLEQIRLERELNDIQGQLNANRQKMTGLEAQLSAAKKEAEDQQDRFRSQALSEMNAVETEISRLQESLKSIGDRVSRAEIKSPVDGVVNNIAIQTIGGVIQPAQQLVEIVPAEPELKITARVSPNDIAFLDVGQDVNVKISAYNAQRYGSLHGKLVRIGANSIADAEGNTFFEVEVQTDKNYLGTAENPLPITPGMVAMIEVVTGRRTILEYLAKPVLMAKDKAFTEI
ncbi:HlyD family type I secretion periplasmic adaptor subunit [Micavibrio aeruginosavorus]|uniref:Type I secretion membrane fusion, HlyD family protein n=1 Tax=Micavibrio aeruginosavorus (strain ARL-13) TaxID=856793 RepID=G2KM90_MICAA|nr:HlyD family type I secretion periplasmic adaptor subunit [Micavibrio aeruginosavorus]AEP10184.1 type I secretion membrane fusion, HlyD family protein [Micavibrio aeruginosavorus ARL-13]